MKNHKYTNEKLGASFELPKAITIRQHLAIKSRMVMMQELDDYYLVFWNAIMPVIENWQCEDVPDLAAVDLNSSNDHKAVNAIMWICNTATDWLSDLESIEGN